MANCPVFTISSNEVSASIAEETCIKVLPANPVWMALEPNSFSDFGNTLNKVTRAPINPSRQRRKGRTVGAEATAGYNTDITASSIARLMQGFLFADAREGASTSALSYPLSSLKTAGVTTAGIEFESTSTFDQTFKPGALVLQSGFTNSGNNGLRRVEAYTAKVLTTSPQTVAEDYNAGLNKVETVGHEFADGAISITLVDGVCALVGSVGAFDDVASVTPGAWVFVGDGTTLHSLGANVGYARIKDITATAIIFDEVTFAPVATTGTGVQLRIFTGRVIRNEKEPSKIVQRTYQIERTLGSSDVSGDPQAEYAVGALASEFTLSVPVEDKLTADINFMATSIEYRTGADGSKLKDGARVEPDAGEEAYNSTSDIVRLRVNIKASGASDAVALTGFVQDANLSINNNLAANKAIGVFGALDYNIGTLEVSGSVTAYFSDTQMLKSIRDDADVEFNCISAFNNKGFIIDLPLLTVDGGSLTVEPDAPVTLPVEMSAVEGEHGFTMLYQDFPYLPNAAMPVA